MEDHMKHIEGTSLSQRAAWLPEEDLSLMSAVCRELSPYERDIQLPMLALDVHMMRRWLLAGLGELGMVAGLEASRRSARQCEWTAMCLQSGDGSESGLEALAQARSRGVLWAPCPNAVRLMWKRRVMHPFESGFPPGYESSREGMGSMEASMVWFYAVMFAIICLAGNMALLVYPKYAGGGFPWLLGFVLATSAMVVARLVVWVRMTDSQRLRMLAWAATPWKMRKVRRFEAWKQQRSHPFFARIKLTGHDYAEIKAALSGASLGQEPRLSREESLAKAAADERALLLTESMAVLGDPVRSLAVGELEDLSLGVGALGLSPAKPGSRARL